MSERLEPARVSLLLSIAVGVITSSDSSVSPMDLRKAADEVQSRAKERSKKTTPRPSVIAINGQEDMIVIAHNPEGSGSPR